MKRHTTKPSTSYELVKAYFSKMSENEQIDSWGLARSLGIEPMSVNIALDKLVDDGFAIREGNWYSLA